MTLYVWGFCVLVCVTFFSFSPFLLPFPFYFPPSFFFFLSFFFLPVLLIVVVSSCGHDGFFAQ